MKNPEPHIRGYHIKTTLGEGGMARVYLATQESLERSVVIKVLNRELSNDPVIRRQFAEESRLIARLNHPNIVQVIEQGTDDQGAAWFVMPYIKSISLAQIIARDDIPLTRRIDIAAQIAKALAYAHHNGIVHRDIKPSNILVDYEGHVRLVDFGIAGYFGIADAEDLVMGTAGYMAPEQQSGSTCPRSDIYALGMIMHELFTGVKPTEKHLMATQPEQEKSQRLAELIALADQCLQPRPEDRPATAEDIRRQLLLAVQGRHLQHNRWGAETFADNIPASYTLLDVLKENPFGATYLVNDPKHRRLLVLKKQRLAEQGNAHACATKLIHIDHPHIARFYGTGKNQRVFIAVSEYLPAGSLQDRLSHAFTLGQWVIIAQQLFLALQCVHDHGVCHGNLRPSNLLFAADNHIKLTDFGYPAHSYGEQSDWYHPRPEKISPAADIYAAGAILFQLFTGRIPSQRWLGLRNRWTLRRLPGALRNIILKMIARHPQARYSRAKDAADDLAVFHDGQDTKITTKTVARPI